MNQLKAYGFPRNDDVCESPLELSEVTFSASPELLRELAKFLEEAATQIADGAQHVHLRDQWSGWQQGGADLIVFRPAP